MGPVLFVVLSEVREANEVEGPRTASPMTAPHNAGDPSTTALRASAQDDKKKHIVLSGACPVPVVLSEVREANEVEGPRTVSPTTTPHNAGDPSATALRASAQDDKKKHIVLSGACPVPVVLSEVREANEVEGPRTAVARLAVLPQLTRIGLVAVACDCLRLHAAQALRGGDDRHLRTPMRPAAGKVCHTNRWRFCMTAMRRMRRSPRMEPFQWLRQAGVRVRSARLFR